MAGAVSKNTSNAARTAAAEQSFDANTANLKHNVTVTRSATPGTGEITVTATATVPTVFMQVVGTTEITMNAQAPCTSVAPTRSSRSRWSSTPRAR